MMLVNTHQKWPSDKEVFWKKLIYSYSRLLFYEQNNNIIDLRPLLQYSVIPQFE